VKINRRKFLKLITSFSLGLFVAPWKRLLASTPSLKKATKQYPDLIGVKDGSPAQMFEIGIKALGGMERFVKKGKTVLVKPNIGWDKYPHQGANTNPDLVGKIVEMAYKAGAQKVYVFDHTCQQMDECYERSGIKEASTKQGATVLPADKEKYYRPITIKKAQSLKKALVHHCYLDVDVVINVPILKHHMGARMTSTLKNLMGVVWDRRTWHRNDLHQCIADFPLVRKPDLNVVDAYLVMMDNGPRGISNDDLKLKRMQILSTDMVLADCAASKILNAQTQSIKYLKLSQDLGHGSMDLKNSVIHRISCKK